jgi:flagellin
VLAINDGGGATGAGTALHGYAASAVNGVITLADADSTSVITATVNNNEHVHAGVAANTSAVSVEAGNGKSAADNARLSIGFIDAAIKQVNVQRSELGAVSNRLNHTVNNLTFCKWKL